MRYADFRKQVWILWRKHRHGDSIDRDYRTWIEAKVVAVLTAVSDFGARELARHIAHDYRMEAYESVHFGDWLESVRDYGFAEQKEASK